METGKDRGIFKAMELNLNQRSSDCTVEETFLYVACGFTKMVDHPGLIKFSDYHCILKYKILEL